MGDLKLALLGFGSAGQAFARMLSEKEDEIRKTYGRGVRVTAIVTRSKGTVVDPSGINLAKACGDIDACGGSPTARRACAA